MKEYQNPLIGYLGEGAKHVLFIGLLLGLWEAGVKRGLIDQSFFGSPGEIAQFLLNEFILTGEMWVELGWTLAATGLAFIIGSLAAVLTAFGFVTSKKLEMFWRPYLSAINAMPRIALAPLFLLWFGLGLGSKVAVGVTLTYFVVLESAIAGIRSVDSDHVTLMRTFGASSGIVFWKITLPNAVPVMFSGLRLGLIYALLGVVGTEIIASTHGIGQKITLYASQFNMSAVMALLFVLALVASLINGALTRVELYLRRWQG